LTDDGNHEREAINFIMERQQEPQFWKVSVIMWKF